ncbi:MAG: L,D-transpeptidase family protein [Rhizobacter sp.]|nr:L,D-transpeptidase family protein [Ferruginibacter sp.]
MYQINGAMKQSRNFHVIFLLAFIVVFAGCGNKKDDDKSISPDEMDDHVEAKIASLLKGTAAKSKLDDSTVLSFSPVVNYYYAATAFKPVWSSMEKWKPYTDSLIQYIAASEKDGLFPDNYQYAALQSIMQNLQADSLKRKDVNVWARADILMTNAFFHILQDLKQGRIQPDSIAWKNNGGQHEKFFSAYIKKLQQGESISSIVASVQPSLKDYQALKKNIPLFLDSMDRTSYSYVNYPGKDSLSLLKNVLKRLAESGYNIPTGKPDSTMLRELITKYQKAKGLKQTGKVSAGLASVLNSTDKEKFKRIAITLDRYKQLPATLPEKYIWVNLPAYSLKVWDNDSLAMESKVIVGKPGTPTPVINSEISDLIVYPTWTVPNSIIVKEILPGLKRNPGYLARKGLGLYSSKGDPVDPYTVNWSKYSKGIPYLVRQGSGDNNALGVIKFNFANPYAVYLHDTNQRYLFKNKERSLSHGCVRVQDWEKLAFYIMRNDSVNSRQPDSLKANTDSITTWISRKERHSIVIKQKLPVFIRYFGCEGGTASIKFYDDIYGEDKKLRDKYFAQK